MFKNSKKNFSRSSRSLFIDRSRPASRFGGSKSKNRWRQVVRRLFGSMLESYRIQVQVWSILCWCENFLIFIVSGVQVEFGLLPCSPSSTPPPVGSGRLSYHTPTLHSKINRSMVKKISFFHTPWNFTPHINYRETFSRFKPKIACWTKKPGQPNQICTWLPTTTTSTLNLGAHQVKHF